MRPSTAFPKLAALVLTGFIAALPANSAGAVAIAIIVNKANSTSSLTARQLKDLFSGGKTRWPDGQKVQALATSPDSPEHPAAIQFLFGMTEQEYRKYTIQANFTGKTDEVPKEAGSPQTVVSQVANTPGAIGFVNASLVGPNVKVVKIDGMAPGDPGYPLGAK